MNIRIKLILYSVLIGGLTLCIIAFCLYVIYNRNNIYEIHEIEPYEIEPYEIEPYEIEPREIEPYEIEPREIEPYEMTIDMVFELNDLELNELDFNELETQAREQQIEIAILYKKIHDKKMNEEVVVIVNPDGQQLQLGIKIT